MDGGMSSPFRHFPLGFCPWIQSVICAKMHLGKEWNSHAEKKTDCRKVGCFGGGRGDQCKKERAIKSSYSSKPGAGPLQLGTIQRGELDLGAICKAEIEIAEPRGL